MRLIFTLLILAGILFAVPLFLEDTSDECSAFSSRAVGLITTASADQDIFSTVITAGIAKLFVGTVLAKDMMATYPSLPPAITCSVFYWQSLYDPQFVLDAWNQNQSKSQ